MMTLTEKRNYIDEDFQQSKLITFDRIPADRREAECYLVEAVRAASSFMLKYRGRGRQIEEYANALAMDWMDSLEKQWRERA
jgi:hypothetical protein